MHRNIHSKLPIYTVNCQFFALICKNLNWPKKSTRVFLWLPRQISGMHTFSDPFTVVTVSLAALPAFKLLSRAHRAFLACSTPAISEWYIWIKDSAVFGTSSHSRELGSKIVIHLSTHQFCMNWLDCIGRSAELGTLGIIGYIE